MLWDSSIIPLSSTNTFQGGKEKWWGNYEFKRLDILTRTKTSCTLFGSSFTQTKICFQNNNFKITIKNLHVG